MLCNTKQLKDSKHHPQKDAVHLNIYNTMTCIFHLKRWSLWRPLSFTDKKKGALYIDCAAPGGSNFSQSELYVGFATNNKAHVAHAYSCGLLHRPFVFLLKSQKRTCLIIYKHINAFFMFRNG